MSLFLNKSNVLNNTEMRARTKYGPRKSLCDGIAADNKSEHINIKLNE